MKKLNKLLELLEADSCEEKFGEYLFGEFSRFYGGVKETDTNYEKKVWAILKEFVQGEYVDREKDKTLVDAFTELQKCQSKYSDVLASKQLTLYRGVPLDPKQYESILPTLKKKEVEVAGSMWHQGTFVYKSKSKNQSWTPKADTAMNFAYPLMTGTGKKAAILKYKFSLGETLFNMKFLNKMSTIYAGSGEVENEVVRMGDKPIKCIVYVELEEE